ncbi:hypothetical protein ACNPAA_09905 [Aeromonas sp. PS2Canimalfood6]|uniref:hypothetical protein n=1 Tax=Aeromonas sp. PS2Canimalfood6 TaxID=3397770 RepID=UPI003AA964FE
MTDQYQAAYSVGLRRPAGSISAASSDEREVLIAVVAMKQGGQPEGKIRLAVMAGELIYANVRLRLTANRTYELTLLANANYGHHV